MNNKRGLNFSPFTFRFSLIALTIVAFVINATAQNALNVKVYTLDNGFTVYLNEDHTMPEVFGIVITKVGSKNDPKDATGMAHYQEHMLFKGTEELGTTDWTLEKPHIDRIFQLYDSLGMTKDDSARAQIQRRINQESLLANEYSLSTEFSDLIKNIGGKNLNANTSEDRTVYYNSFPPNQVEKWIDIYSHHFINPVFRSFQSELEVIYEEKNMYNDNFFIPILETFQRNFFKNHPYGQQTTIGSIDHLKNPSLTKMYNFFKTYYVASNMGLVLSGDFNTDEVMPLIKEKFGKLNTGTVPQFPKYTEEEFKGRELVSIKASPVKLEIMGYRTVPKGSPDELAIEIINSILSNQDQTGLIDKLSLEHKILGAQVVAYPYNDYGMDVIFVIPKIVGQSLDDAEKIVTDEIEQLCKGNFSDSLIDAIKKQKYKEYQLQFENAQSKALLLAESFNSGRTIQEIIEYPDKIKAITKADVMRVAQKYFGKNYIIVQSSMGSPKKEKIAKPGYAPMLPKTNVKSKYAQYFEKMNVKAPVERYVDFDKDIKTSAFAGNNKFYYTPNPYNDIFTLTIRYGIGEDKMPLLKYGTTLVNLAGTDKHTLSQLKSAFSEIGCSYGISSDKSYVTIELQGIESELNKSIQLVNEILTKPVVDKKKIDLIVDGEKTNRKFERNEPESVGQALFDYIRYKEKSDFINRLSIKQIKKLNTDSLISEFLKATNYQAEIFYTGKRQFDDVFNIISSNLKLNKTPLASNSPVYQESQEYKENTIFLIDKPKSLQSKIYLYTSCAPSDPKREAIISAFNMYFSGDFSGLVLQEIREYRSMAYSAGASYGIPPIKGMKAVFAGFVGTQSDKTVDAIDVFMGLIRTMPEKPERMDMIKDYLMQVTLTSRPTFRNLAKSIVAWQYRGFDEDPAKSKVNQYKNFTFDDIVKFYKAELQQKPIVITIVGDKKRIDMKKLEKYGRIVEMKEKDVFSK